MNSRVPVSYTHLIRVKDLGKVVERSAPPTIERKDRERIVTVSAVISGCLLYTSRCV